MQKTKLSKTYILVLIVAICLSFILGDRFATFQMYREQLAQASLIELANNVGLDNENTLESTAQNEQNTVKTDDSTNNITTTTSENNIKNNSTTTTQPTAPQTKNLININTASLGELVTLPGIGEVKAQAIIDYRERYGSFYSTEEIMNVGGIGEKTYAQLKDLICI